MPDRRRLQLRRNLDDSALEIDRWERQFRDDFAIDAGARFRSDARRFDLQATSEDMLEATITLVRGCCTMREVDGRAVASFLALQEYGESHSDRACYRLLLQMSGTGIGVVIADAKLREIDLADLYAMPWEQVERVGYEGFWTIRVDGQEFSRQEVDALEDAITADLRADYSEDEVRFFVDPDTWAGCVYCRVYDHSAEGDS